MMMHSNIFKSKVLTSFLMLQWETNPLKFTLECFCQTKEKELNNAPELPHNDNIVLLKMGHKESEKNGTNLLKQLCSLAYSKNYSCLWGEQF